MKIEPPLDEPPWVPYGPGGDRLPARFAAVVDYAERPLRARIRASFDGVGRVHADVVSVERTDGESITPEDMTDLVLASVMGSVVDKATKRGRGTYAGGGRTESGPPTDAELLKLARMYWFEYISWGQPRRAVMSAFELPRSSANRWIRKARELYGLPGVHADGEEV